MDGSCVVVRPNIGDWSARPYEGAIRQLANALPAENRTTDHLLTLLHEHGYRVHAFSRKESTPPVDIESLADPACWSEEDAEFLGRSVRTDSLGYGSWRVRPDDSERYLR